MQYADQALCFPAHWPGSENIVTVMEHLCGKLHVIRPHNGSNKRLQPSLVTAEEGLVVALVLVVLL